MALLTFPATSQWEVGRQEIYLREHWSDVWEFQPFLHCDDATWCAAPSMPTATLSWIYGDVASEVSVAWGERLKKTSVLRFFVRIRFELQLQANGLFTTREWYGVLEVVEDYLGGGRIRTVAGAQQTTAVGEQRLVCLGLEKLLQDQVVDHSWWRSGGEAKRLGRALTFNEGGKPNRELAPQVEPHFVFGNDEKTNLHWSSRNIVHYLLRHHTPRDWANNVLVPFELVDTPPRVVPLWDRPQLIAERTRTYDLLNQLMPRQRLVSWYTTVNLAANTVQIRPFTFTEAALAHDLGDPIPANPRQWELNFESDRSAIVAVKDSAIDICDQVIVRGARRRSCFTVAYAHGTLQNGWTPQEEERYRVAASDAADYPDAEEIKDRQQRDREARQQQLVRRVYSRFELIRDWDGLVYSAGEGMIPAFPWLAIGQPNVFNPYTLGMEIEPTTPLLEGVDYSGDKVKQGNVNTSTATSSLDEMPILVAWLLPNTDPERYLPIERLGELNDIEELEDAENFQWTASVHVVPHSKAFEIRVHSQPQHVIAKTDFTPLALDDPLGDHDFRDMLVTVSVQTDAYCEAKWPALPPANVDCPRRLFLDAGDGYKQDYLVRDTVVGVNNSGELQYSSGGYLRDDSPLLLAAAKVAHAWYQRRRAVLEFRTHQLNSQLFVGDFVTSIGDPQVVGGHTRSIGSVVTQVRLVWQRSVDADPPPPSMDFVTQAGELDPLHLIGPSRSR